MACDLWRAKIDAYVDAELSAEEMHAFDAHLRGCPSCATAVLGQVQWKRATQIAGRRYVPNAEFRRRIEQEITVLRRPAWLGSWLPRLAAAAAVVILAFLAGNRWQASQR
jgi:anti-sigma factor RsiW